MHPQPASVDNRELRKFGVVFSAILLFLFEALLPWLRAHPLPLWPVYIAVPVTALALLWPAGLRPLYHGWMKFGAVMGAINTRIIMTVFFFVVLAPIGYLMRLLGKDPMARSLDPAAASYRVQSARQEREHVEKPY